MSPDVTEFSPLSDCDVCSFLLDSARFPLFRKAGASGSSSQLGCYPDSFRSRARICCRRAEKQTTTRKIKPNEDKMSQTKAKREKGN